MPLLRLALVSLLVVALAADARPTAQMTGRVSGASTTTIHLVNGNGGAPIEGAVIHAIPLRRHGLTHPQSPTSPELSLAWTGSCSFTGADGRAAIEGVALPAVIVAVAPGGRTVAAKCTVEDGPLKRVTVWERDAVEVRVVDGDARPVEGAWVQWAGHVRFRGVGVPRSRARTGPDGVARLVATQTDVLRLWEDGAAEVQLEFSLGTDAGVQVQRRGATGSLPTLVMPKTRPLRIVATDRAGVFPPGVPAVVWISDHEPQGGASDGVFRAIGPEGLDLRHVPAGADLWIGHGWRGLSDRLLHATRYPASRSKATLAFDPVDSLVCRARILDGSGQPLVHRDVTVSLGADNVRVARIVRTNSEGRVLFDGHTLSLAVLGSGQVSVGDTRNGPMTLRVQSASDLFISGSSDALGWVGEASIPKDLRAGLRDFGDIQWGNVRPWFQGRVVRADGGDLEQVRVRAVIESRSGGMAGAHAPVTRVHTRTGSTSVDASGNFAIAFPGEKRPALGSVVKSEVEVSIHGVDVTTYSAPIGSLDLDLVLGGSHEVRAELPQRLARANNLWGVLTGPERSYEGPFQDGALTLKGVRPGRHSLRVFALGTLERLEGGRVEIIEVGGAGSQPCRVSVPLSMKVGLTKLVVTASDGTPAERILAMGDIWRAQPEWREELALSTLGTEVADLSTSLDLAAPRGVYWLAVPEGASLALDLDMDGHVTEEGVRIGTDHSVTMTRAHTVALRLSGPRQVHRLCFFRFEPVDSGPWPGERAERSFGSRHVAATGGIEVDLPGPGRYRVRGSKWTQDPKTGQAILDSADHGILEVPAGNGVVVDIDIGRD